MFAVWKDWESWSKGESFHMNSSTQSQNHSRILTICIIALLLAVVLPAAAAANSHRPPAVPSNDDEEIPPPPPPPSAGNTGTTSPTATPTPTPSGNGGTEPPPPPSGNSGTDPPPPDDPTLTQFELYIALAPNRIVFHAATPAQLCRVEEGLQYYFIGRDGSTYFGPWVPPFAELAESYPDGEAVSIYSGPNPLTGKPVAIDYLPSVKRIRVSTFYADREHDKNKPYIFHFGPEHDITYDAW